MIGRMKIKRALKQTIGWAATLTMPFTWQAKEVTACILAYHRVAEVGFVDPQLDDWNVSPDIFEQQIATLAKYAEIVPLMDLQTRLATSQINEKPLVCLTFDDGYASVSHDALAILEKYQAPATIFLVTKYIGSKKPFPFDRWSQKNSLRVSSKAWQGMSWTDVERCVASGMITVGAHSHEHLDGRNCTTSQLIEEVERSREILLRRLGAPHAQAYAYPYGSTRLGEVPASYAAAVRQAGFRLAVTTDLGLAKASHDPFLLPRVEAHAKDSKTVMRAKAIGALTPFHITDKLRQAVRIG